MKHILPIFATALAALLCQEVKAQSSGQGGAGQGSGTSYPTLVNDDRGDDVRAAQLVRALVDAIDTRQSIAARIRQQTELFGHRLVGSGSYAQQGRGGERLVRLELKIPVADQLSSFEQICDGSYLWLRQELGGKVSLSRVDLLRVREALRTAPTSETRASSRQADVPLAAGQGGASALSFVRTDFAWGGLPKLLHALESCFQFENPQEGNLDSLPVWTLRGQWRRERLAELFPEQKERILSGQPVKLGKAADHFPDRVLLAVGRDDLFPYRIEFWQHKKADKNNPNGEGFRTLLLMELFEVQLDAPLDPRGFAYKPGELEIKDVTAEFLQQLGIDERAPGR